MNPDRVSGVNRVRGGDVADRKGGDGRGESRGSRGFGAVLRACALASALVAGAAQAGAEESLAQRLGSVETLVERSSAARRIESSNVVEAASGRDAARELLTEAKSAAAAGDTPRANQLLTRATATMIAAARAADGANANGAPTDEMLASAIESARSMAGAARRVATERGELPKLGAALGKIEEAVDEAVKERAAGRRLESRDAARRAYLSARVLVVEMRQGTTLVRSLDFATPADEYRYELDRNDAHRMILEMVRAERQLDPSTTTLVQQALDGTRAARERAEQLAAKGQHRAAIVELDTATRQLLAAIRRAGLYVPG